MADREVLVSELGDHIGSYIEFEFNFGWGDFQVMRGYLHGISRHADGYMDYLHINDKPNLEKGQRPVDMGGYAMEFNKPVTITKPPTS